VLKVEFRKWRSGPGGRKTGETGPNPYRQYSLYGGLGAPI